MTLTEISKYFFNNKDKWLKDFWETNNLSNNYSNAVSKYLNDQSLVALSQGQKDNLKQFSNGKLRNLSLELGSIKSESNTFEEFLLKANKTFNKYSEWLKVEGDHVKKASLQIKQWNNIINKGGYKLQWVTAEDEKVRDEHRTLNGLTRPVDDNFWKNQFPGQAPNCRCTYKLVKGKDTDITGDMMKVKSPNDYGFNVNAGIDGVFFSRNHNYLK